MKLMQFLAGGAALLVSGALVIAADEKPQQEDRPVRGDPARLLEQFDKNKDGFLDRSEVPERMKDRFDALDANKDGKLDKTELAKAAGRAGKPAARPGEVITPAAKGERKTDQLQVGDVAPDFTLPRLSGKGKVTLAGLEGKPVVLIFASYT